MPLNSAEVIEVKLFHTFYIDHVYSAYILNESFPYADGHCLKLSRVVRFDLC